MKRIRVLLGDMPRILRELIDDAVSDTTDMLVVGSADAAEGLASSVERSQADVLIIGVADDADGARLQTLLYTQPRLRLVTIGGNGRSTTMHELRPISIPLGEVTPRVLLDAIRSSASGAG